MSIEVSYDRWASQYDTNTNPTRDLEGIALRKMLEPFQFQDILELGCGTGKNTSWLLGKTSSLLSVDLSAEMLAKAKAKINANHVEFMQADLRQPWTFTSKTFDLVSFSLVLEHIEDLNDIFEKVSNKLNHGGLVYIGELHPFKQYNGSKARFEDEKGVQVVECYNHNLSDYTRAAQAAGFSIKAIDEFFDNSDRSGIPRILSMIFRKRE